MARYDVQQVCLKGHQITDRFNEYPQHRKNFCPTCGSRTITECPACRTPIRGDYLVDGLVSFAKTDVPTHCEGCGAAYPWNPATADVGTTPSPWADLHPAVVTVARPRFEAGQLADAVEAALKAVNTRVKAAWVRAGNTEDDGANLMRRALSPRKPVIVLGDLSTDTGRSMQQGYMDIFAGAMTGVRNPKAHDNISIDARRATHFLFLASLLMYKLDESGAA